MLIEKLRKATGSLHAKTENLLFANAKSFDMNWYGFFLRANFHFHQAYEPVVTNTDFAKQPEWNNFDRNKSDKLYQDLSFLKFLPEKPLVGNYFEGWSEPQLLGAAYVSEGSGLGGQVILRNMMKISAFDEKRCGKFIHGHGSLTGVAWKAFLELLEKEGRHNEHTVVDGAISAFGFFETIIKSLRKDMYNLADT
ncbi:biliverdin-producing heme oxygenase [Fulvivirga ulvae]|uniref:biliverdin-producing heme oxygenase n=1 Tax=Fulvivirga ulvae TaxID=2904245 RepID=UPI001F24E1B1|nr:biliverdin-producing heme oxygenase [Fulvivirga ulvae]UII35001.1 biliverdin-producing heme oxygenase [Fulvivirga ulvae]